MPLEDLGRDATFFPHHSQQQMFGFDCCAAKLTRFIPSEENHTPRALSLPDAKETPSVGGSYTEVPNTITNKYDSGIGICSPFRRAILAEPKDFESVL
jgi:hypothetical protein